MPKVLRVARCVAKPKAANTVDAFIDVLLVKILIIFLRKLQEKENEHLRKVTHTAMAVTTQKEQALEESEALN